MGIVDVVSSLGVADFNIDDYPGVVAWSSCPQKGVLSLPLTYAPVSFTDKAIDLVSRRGCHTYVHHPILEGRHWGIVAGKTSRRLCTTGLIPVTRWRHSMRLCAYC